MTGCGNLERGKSFRFSRKRKAFACDTCATRKRYREFAFRRRYGCARKIEIVVNCGQLGRKLCASRADRFCAGYLAAFRVPRVYCGNFYGVFAACSYIKRESERFRHARNLREAVEIGKEAVCVYLPGGFVFNGYFVVVNEIVVCACGHCYRCARNDARCGIDVYVKHGCARKRGGFVCVCSADCIFRKVRAVCLRGFYFPRRFEGAVVGKIHSRYANVAACVHLNEQADGNFVRVLRHGCACHVAVAALDGKVAHGAASERGKRRLHN